MYDYPRNHPKLGVLSPTPAKIAQALAAKDASRIQPSGAYAADLLGLSEQVPAKAIFLTDVAGRRITVGREEIILKRTALRNKAKLAEVWGEEREGGQESLESQVR